MTLDTAGRFVLERRVASRQACAALLMGLELLVKPAWPQTDRVNDSAPSRSEGGQQSRRQEQSGRVEQSTREEQSTLEEQSDPTGLRGVLGRYEVVAGCPDSSWFLRQLGRRHTQNSREPGARLDVEVERYEAKFVGRLTDRAHPAQAVRQIEHARCTELLQAMSLIAALMLEGRAELVAPSPEAHAEEVRSARQGDAMTVRGRAPYHFRHGPSVGLTLLQGVAPDFRLGPRVGYGGWLTLEHGPVL
ncbi:MAG TPA: hypothetical protein VFQ61_34360, partial [Polyangiaceae bacterium]|nr:hypothetical protein [Polyangiaceae bacterium]